MNLILFYKEDYVASDIIELAGRRAKHIKSVHRAKVGDKLTVGECNGLIGIGEVLSIEDGKVKLKVELNCEPPKPIPVKLFLALARPKSLKKALHVALTMGVKEIYLINSYRVDKSYWSTPVLSEEGLREEIELALEQSKDTVWPKIELKKLFKPFVEDEIKDIVGEDYAMVAHPGVDISCPFNVGKPVSLAIGPEGGFIPYEVDLLKKYGFEPVSIGDHILRVEFAIPAILGKLF